MYLCVYRIRFLRTNTLMKITHEDWGRLPPIGNSKTSLVAANAHSLAIPRSGEWSSRPRVKGRKTWLKMEQKGRILVGTSKEVPAPSLKNRDCFWQIANSHSGSFLSRYCVCPDSRALKRDENSFSSCCLLVITVFVATFIFMYLRFCTLCA